LSGFATVDLGLRQQFVLGNIPTSIRFVVFNVFDKASWKVVGPDTLFVDDGRRFSISITSDF